MDIESYVSVDGVPFGASRAMVISRFGAFRTRRINRRGEEELHYDNMTLILDPVSADLKECVLHINVPTRLNGRRIDWALEGLMNLCLEDGNPRYFAGTVVLTNLGIALTGLEENAESDRALAAFKQGVWDSLLERAVPFVPSGRG